MRYSGGAPVVMGVASSATAHVQDMVAKQNTARKGKKEEEGLATEGEGVKVEVEVPLEVGGEVIWLGIHSTEVFKAGQI